MRTVRLFATLAFTCSLLAATSSDAGFTFGSGANQFEMAFVEIGSPGNAADTTGNPNPAGAVSYTYNMGKYAVSRDMITKANADGNLGITLNTSSVFTSANQPATGVSWFEAARFVNWLNTEQGFQEAYNFDDNGNFQLWSSADAWQLDGENRFRHKDAGFWLPSMDEWYKAAYYDPDTSTYFNFPTGSNTAPTAVAGGTADGTAVYGQLFAQGPADITNAGGLSPFGVMGMGGNVWEWEETTADFMNASALSTRGVRGGSWNFSSSSLSSSSRFGFNPAGVNSGIGFRVASLSSPAAVVPEPGSLAIWGVMCVGGWCYRKRRLRK